MMINMHIPAEFEHYLVYSPMMFYNIAMLSSTSHIPLFHNAHVLLDQTDQLFHCADHTIFRNRNILKIRYYDL